MKRNRSRPKSKKKIAAAACNTSEQATKVLKVSGYQGIEPVKWADHAGARISSYQHGVNSICGVHVREIGSFPVEEELVGA